MAFLQMLFLLCPIFMHFIVPNTAQPEINFHLCVVENGNYTANSTYQANLKYLLNSVYSNTEIDYGFYNFSYGESPDKVYAIGLCRGDVKPGACRDCLNYSSLALTSLCPTQKEAIIGLDNCILRYASRYIFGLNEVAPYFFVYSLTNVSDEKGFNRSLNSLLDSLQDEAAAGDPRRKQNAVPASEMLPHVLDNVVRKGKEEESFIQAVILGKKNTVIIVIILSFVISVMVILIISFYTFSGKRKSREKVKIPQKPAFFARSTELPGTTSTWTESDQSRSASVPCSINEASISELYPR
ncbi:hypothetical protein D5086_007894 [Populus alba]|uniref:Uncharacterized protein n=1 Tax=Populus alba TaxID=43335 RepID=A0ACC4CF41_POPAL